MNTDEHGLKKEICFACGEEKLIANRHLRISEFGTAARRLELICVYRARHASKASRAGP